MELFSVENPKIFIESILSGQKTAIFSIDKSGNPISLITKVHSKEITKNDKISQILAPAIDYIKHNLNKEIRQEDLAAKCDVSYSYFSKLFRDCYGIGCNEYIIKLRVKYAKLLLASTNKSIVMIASELGYFDGSYFNKIFKKEEGVSPLVWRKNHSLLNSSSPNSEE